MSNMRRRSIVLICLLCGMGKEIYAEDSTATVQPAQHKQQNAVLKSIEFVSTPSEKVKDEFVGTCRFVFNGHPAGYVNEMKNKENKLVFGFKDAVLGKNSIPSCGLSPFSGFTIEDCTYEGTRDWLGQPETHDGVRVSFDTKKFPQIKVRVNNDTTSFNYKWTTDTTRYQMYVEKEKPKPIVLFILKNFWPVLVVFIWGCVATILTVKH